jgi:hypothetical protein
MFVLVAALERREHNQEMDDGCPEQEQQGGAAHKMAELVSVEDHKQPLIILNRNRSRTGL